jgi:hypothetical protein
MNLIFAVFTQYRRLLLAAHGIDYTNCWVAVIQALILGIVIMIGSIFHLGRGLEQRPLIYPTLYKAAVFTLFIGALTLLEHAVKGLWKGNGIAGGIAELLGRGSHELLAAFLGYFVALIPYFGAKELGRVFGQDRIRALFFRKGAVQSMANGDNSNSPRPA